MISSDIHIHTTYCDGKSTAEEMINAALLRGFTTLGFSGHEFMSFDTSWCMSREGTAAYIEELKQLRAKYADRINILIGTERDMFSDKTDIKYDYVIGSVHYIKKDGCYLPVDESADRQIQAVKEHFDGDFYKYTAAFFELEARILKETSCDVIGHFDLVCKFNEGNALFDEEDKRYKAQVYAALEELVADKPVFEINTGAITRGYRTRAYPDMEYIRYIAAKGCGFVLTSDCHDAKLLGKDTARVESELAKYPEVTRALLIPEKFR